MQHLGIDTTTNVNKLYLTHPCKPNLSTICAAFLDSSKLTAPMTRSDEAAAFYIAVYLAVQEIPQGKVTSYGHIAKLIGTRMSKQPPQLKPLEPELEQLTVSIAQRPRQVGICLKHLSQDPGARHHSGNVPWQRVINAKGVISPRCVQCQIHESKL
jgi:alkylated DNA nucleotide flippase Atl1